MTILGYDIDGQPLRAGDRVVTVGVMLPVEHLGVVCTVIGPDPSGEGDFEVDIPWPHGPGWRCSWGEDVRKLPPKQADNETATWESIEQLTGWVPEGVRV